MALAGPAAVGFIAELLVMLIARVGNEIIAAAQAFHRSGKKTQPLMPSSTPATFRRPRATTTKKNQPEEERRDLVEGKGRKSNQEDYIFKPALSSRFQIGAHTGF